MGRHTPTRVDLRTEGWTSGTDMPLPRACQTALCHHREHQLSRDRPQDAVALDAALIVDTALENAEPMNQGWAAPSSIFTDPTRTHKAFYRRKWLKRGWQPKSGWMDVLCGDMDCDKEHTSSLPLDPPLDLPTISIRRGGLRFYPEFPMYEYRVSKHKGQWQVQYRLHDSRTWVPCPALTFWRLRKALNARDLLRSMQNGTREVYVNRVLTR